MVFVETNLIPLIQNGIDEWVDRASSETSNEELTEYIGLILRSYGYQRIPHLPFDSGDNVHGKVMDALEGGHEIIYYKLQTVENDVKLASVRVGDSYPHVTYSDGVPPFVCEFMYWDDEGDEDELETLTFFDTGVMSETIGFDYKVKQVVSGGVMDLITIWNFKNDSIARFDEEHWWVKTKFLTFQPFNTVWPEWFVKSIEAVNTKV